MPGHRWRKGGSTRRLDYARRTLTSVAVRQVAHGRKLPMPRDTKFSFSKEELLGQVRRFAETVEGRAKSNPWVQRLTEGDLRQTIDARLDGLRSTIRDAVGLASRSELEKLHKKV